MTLCSISLSDVRSTSSTKLMNPTQLKCESLQWNQQGPNSKTGRFFLTFRYRCYHAYTSSKHINLTRVILQYREMGKREGTAIERWVNLPSILVYIPISPRQTNRLQLIHPITPIASEMLWKTSAINLYLHSTSVNNRCSIAFLETDTTQSQASGANNNNLN